MTTPFVQALRANKAVGWLLFVEAVCTVAILANTASIAGTNVLLSRQSSGLDEAGVIAVSFDEFDGSSELRLQEDFAALSAIPGVLSAALVNGIPFGGDSSTTVSSSSAQGSRQVEASIVRVGPGAIATLGIRVSHGRSLEAEDFVEAARRPLTVIISADLARRLFASESPLGRMLLIRGTEPLRIIGFSERLMRPSPVPSMDSDNGLTVMLPTVPEASYATYVLKVRPGDAANVIAALGSTGWPDRQPHAVESAITLSESRKRYFAASEADAKLMLVTTFAVALFSQAGISGLVAFTVARRRRSIGISRAVGATRIRAAWDTFMLLSMPLLAGSVIGALLSYGIHAALGTLFPLAALKPVFPAASAGMVMLLSCCAMLVPTFRAAWQDPVAAMRA